MDNRSDINLFGNFAGHQQHLFHMMKKQRNEAQKKIILMVINKVKEIRSKIDVADAIKSLNILPAQPQKFRYFYGSTIVNTNKHVMFQEDNKTGWQKVYEFMFMQDQRIFDFAINQHRTMSIAKVIKHKPKRTTEQKRKCEQKIKKFFDKLSMPQRNSILLSNSCDSLQLSELPEFSESLHSSYFDSSESSIESPMIRRRSTSRKTPSHQLTHQQVTLVTEQDTSPFEKFQIKLKPRVCSKMIQSDTKPNQQNKLCQKIFESYNKARRPQQNQIRQLSHVQSRPQMIRTRQSAGQLSELRSSFVKRPMLESHSTKLLVPSSPLSSSRNYSQQNSGAYNEITPAQPPRRRLGRMRLI